VTTHALDLLGVEVDLVRLRVECSAGFYVRSLAHDLGMALGTGGHITALRRTRSGSATIEAAVPLGELEQQPEGAPRRLIPMAGMLHEYPFLVLSPEGVRHAVQGRTLVAGDLAEGAALPARSGWSDEPVRLLTPAGELLALATWRDPRGVAPVLHPSVVLG
jgi:tRNA pseudouridine55 synthase